MHDRGKLICIFFYNWSMDEWVFFRDLLKEFKIERSFYLCPHIGRKCEAVVPVWTAVSSLPIIIRHTFVWIFILLSLLHWFKTFTIF